MVITRVPGHPQGSEFDTKVKFMKIGSFNGSRGDNRINRLLVKAWWSAPCKSFVERSFPGKSKSFECTGEAGETKTLALAPAPDRSSLAPRPLARLRSLGSRSPLHQAFIGSAPSSFYRELLLIVNRQNNGIQLHFFT